MHQLEAYGVRGLPHKWLSSYLSIRVQYFMFKSLAYCLKNGQYPIEWVPQEAILGPILFLIYVNNLNQSIQNGETIQYADDTTLCFKAKNKTGLEINAFLDLSSSIQFFSEIVQIFE